MYHVWGHCVCIAHKWNTPNNTTTNNNKNNRIRYYVCGLERKTKMAIDEPCVFLQCHPNIYSISMLSCCCCSCQRAFAVVVVIVNPQGLNVVRKLLTAFWKKSELRSLVFTSLVMRTCWKFSDSSLDVDLVWNAAAIVVLVVVCFVLSLLLPLSLLLMIIVRFVLVLVLVSCLVNYTQRFAVKQCWCSGFKNHRSNFIAVLTTTKQAYLLVRLLLLPLPTAITTTGRNHNSNDSNDRKVNSSNKYVGLVIQKSSSLTSRNSSQVALKKIMMIAVVVVMMQLLQLLLLLLLLCFPDALLMVLIVVFIIAVFITWLSVCYLCLTLLHLYWLCHRFFSLLILQCKVCFCFAVCVCV